MKVLAVDVGGPRVKTLVGGTAGRCELASGSTQCAQKLDHLPLRQATWQDFAGLQGHEQLGKRRWRERLPDPTKGEST